MGIGIEPPDDVLVVRARDGDTNAFELLLRRHLKRMYVLAARITGSPSDAEDAVQLACATAWNRLATFRGDSAFSTWLYRIVTNQSLASLRRHRVTTVLPDDAGGTTTPGHRGPEASAQHHALAHALAEALAALPDELRVAWLLREAEDCSYDEIAVIVGATPSTVRGRLARARARLATQLADWR